jgi:hypothetical protein
LRLVGTAIGAAIGAAIGCATVAVAHGAHLLELLGSEDGLQLLAGAVLDGAHLVVFVLRSELLVGPEGGHLLVAIGEDGQELGGLLGAEVELLGEACGLALGVGLMVAVVERRLTVGGLLLVLLRRLGLLRLLCESRAAKECKRESECCGEDGAVHRSDSWLRLGKRCRVLLK